MSHPRIHSGNARLNFDGLFAAKVTGGLAVGIGYSGRYDHNPLPGKQDFDSSTTVSLIWAFSDVPQAPPTLCPCPKPGTPPPPTPAGPAAPVAPPAASAGPAPAP